MDGHSDFTTISSAEAYENCIRNFHEFDANQFGKLVTSPFDSTPLRYNVFFFSFSNNETIHIILCSVKYVYNIIY